LNTSCSHFNIRFLLKKYNTTLFKHQNHKHLLHYKNDKYLLLLANCIPSQTSHKSATKVLQQHKPLEKSHIIIIISRISMSPLDCQPFLVAPFVFNFTYPFKLAYIYFNHIKMSCSIECTPKECHIIPLDMWQSISLFIVYTPYHQNSTPKNT
jgi:hypothetical protein